MIKDEPKNIVDLIVAEAKREDVECFKNKMYKNLKYKNSQRERGIIENSLISPLSNTNIVDIREIPVSFSNFTNFDPNVKKTAGMYTLKYVPKTDRRYIPGKPFLIGQDLVMIKINVSGPKHWRCLASRIPELNWINRNTNISSGLFGIAKKHPGIPFFFSVDWVGYGDMITKKAEEMGIDIDNKPFVAYKCSMKDYEEKYKGKQLNPIKQYKDYIKEIEESNKESEEIKEEV